MDEMRGEDLCLIMVRGHSFDFPVVTRKSLHSVRCSETPFNNPMALRIRQMNCFLIVHTCLLKHWNRLTKYVAAVISGAHDGDAQWDLGKLRNVGKFPADWNSEK